MNDRCTRKDCKYRTICGARSDLVECAWYSRTAIVPDCWKCIHPMDRQLSLIPAGSTGEANGKESRTIVPILW